MTTLQLIFYQAHEIARREMACDAGRRYYGTYRAAFSDALRIIHDERKHDDAQICNDGHGFDRLSGQQLAPGAGA